MNIYPIEHGDIPAIATSVMVFQRENVRVQLVEHIGGLDPGGLGLKERVQSLKRTVCLRIRSKPKRKGSYFQASIFRCYVC